MILLNLKNIKIEKVLNNIYKNVIDYKMENIIEILYHYNPNKNNLLPSNMILSYLFVEIKNFEDMDEFDIEEIFFDFIENKYPLIFDFADTSDILKQMIHEIANDIGLIYIDYSNVWNTDISKEEISDLTMNTIFEIFEQKSNKINYSLENFLYVYNVENNGDFISNDNQLIGNILNETLESFIFTKTSDYLKRKEILNNFNNIRLFNNKIGSLIPFIKDIEDIEDKIQKFKEDIFKELLNIDAKKYSSLNKEVVQLLNEHNYIKMDDILNILDHKGIINNKEVSQKHFYVIK